ncbi:Uncharacterised protein [Mycobacterium tuberculosis]|nr:Uncharacterised protein [Mycobacterium tuberculosis]
MQGRGGDILHVLIVGTRSKIHAGDAHRCREGTTHRAVTIGELTAQTTLTGQSRLSGVQLAEGALIVALETIVTGTRIVPGRIHEERNVGSVRILQASHEGDILANSTFGGTAVLTTVLRHLVLRVPVAGGVLNLRSLMLGQVVVSTRGGDVLGQHIQRVSAVHGTAQHHDLRPGLQVALASDVPAALASGGALSLHLFGRARSVTGGSRCRGGGFLRLSRCGGFGCLRLGALAGIGRLSLGDGRLGLLRRRRGRRGGRKRVLRVVSRVGGAGGRRGVFARGTAEATSQGKEQGGGASGGAHRAATPTGRACLSVVKRHRYLSRE